MNNEELLHERDKLYELISDIALYVNWRWLTSNLTTEQKELWADAIEADCAKRYDVDNSDDRVTVNRWWRDDAISE